MRILWHYSVLNLGGAELSTIRLLDGLRRRGHAPVLLLNLPGGAAEPRLPAGIEVRHLRPTAAARPGRGGAPVGAGAAARYLRARAHQSVRAAGLRFGERFGAAVIGLQGLVPGLVCNAVPAARRLHFIRNDLAACDPDGRIARAIGASAHRIDAYVCVSETARRSLLAAHPALAGKAHTIHNILDAAAMRAAAAGPDPFAPTGRLKVLTVARLSDRAKGLVRMVRVHRALLDQGLDVDWYVAGDGADRPLLGAAIAAAGTGARMHLLGPQANPFPYYRHADIVAVLSHYEGLSGAINEAKVLMRPVIATDVGGAREQLGGEGDGGDGGEGGGLIVAPDDAAIEAGLARLVRSPDLRRRLAATPLPAALLDDEAKLDRLVDLLGGERVATGAGAMRA